MLRGWLARPTRMRSGIGTVTWTQRPSPTTHTLWAVAAHNDRYVAVGSEMLISTNGLDREELTYYYAVTQNDPFNCIAPVFRKHPINTGQRIGSGDWQRVVDVVASATDRLVSATNDTAPNQAYFRLATLRTE